MESKQYEFNNTQERLIKELAQKMRFVSFFLIAIGVLLIISGLIAIAQRGLSDLIYGIVQLLIGIWTNTAASSFAKIAATRGNDIENLMNALGELRKLYALQYWLFIVALIFVVIGLIAAILFSP